MAPSHYLNQHWQKFAMPYSINRPQWVDKIMYSLCFTQLYSVTYPPYKDQMLPVSMEKVCKMLWNHLENYSTCNLSYGWSLLKSSSPGQNGRHFGRRQFQMHFPEWKWWNSDSISTEFVTRSPVHNTSTLVQIMACRLFGDQPLPEPMLTQFIDEYMRH